MDCISAQNTVWCYLLEKDTQNIFTHFIGNSLCINSTGTSALGEIKGPANTVTRSDV